MTFNRNKLFWAFVYFLVAAAFLQIGGKTSWTTEFAIFNLKVALILFAVYLSTSDKKD